MILIQKGWLTKRLSKAKQTSNSEKEKKKKASLVPTPGFSTIQLAEVGVGG